MLHGLIRVERGEDPHEGEIKLKSTPADASANQRRIARLDHGAAFSGEKLSERTDAAWKSAGLNRITLHECRHTFAS